MVIDTGTGIFGRSRSNMLDQLETSDVPDAVYEAVTGFTKSGQPAPQHPQRYKLADARFFSVKRLNVNLVKMLEDSDKKKKGFTNFVNGQLPKNTFMLVAGIKLEVLRTATGAEAEVLSGEFKTLFNNSDFAFVTNGESTLTVNRTSNVFMDLANNGYARPASGGQVEEGVLYLDNSRLLHPEVQIDFNLDLATLGQTNLDFIKATFIGTALIPA